MNKKIKIFVRVTIPGAPAGPAGLRWKREINAEEVTAPGITRRLALHQGDFDTWKLTDIESGGLIKTYETRRKALQALKTLSDYLSDQMIINAAAKWPPLDSLPVQEPET